MPKEYEAIRDSLKKRGKSDKEAERIAAATYNKRHPDDPMGPSNEARNLLDALWGSNVPGNIIDEGVTPDTTIIITARDPDGTLRKLLDCIRNTGNGGHSFSIVVDPEEQRGLSERKFFWDGDGPDHIFEIE